MPVFDSNEFIKRLASAGMPEGQAEVLAHTQIQLLADQIASKEDLRNEIAMLRLEMHAEFESLEKRMLLRMGALFATGFGLFFAALTFVIAYVR